MFLNPAYYSIILLPFITSFIVVCITTPICIIFIKKLGLLDDPKKHKHPAILHTKPIPRGGGIPIFIGILVAGILFLPLTKITIALFLASTIALLSGALDDKFDTSPHLRLAINILSALIVIGSGIGIPFITNPVGGILAFNSFQTPFAFLGFHSLFIFSDLLALLWIVWVMNMLNWSKGVDGQMPGIVVISAIVIGIVSLRFPINEVNTLISAKLSFMIAGSALGFLIFNFSPAKIFPGYSATAVYLLLSVVSILSGAKLATAILVMGVPMIDAGFTVIRRIASGKSPVWHDKKHLHHLLLKLGWSQRHIALFYWIISAILGTLSLTLTSTGKAFAIAMLIVLAGGGLLFLHLVLRNIDEEEII